MYSQQMWNTGITSQEFSAEYIKPNFTNDIIKIKGEVINLTGRISVGDRKSFIINLPYYQASVSFNSNFSSTPDLKENTFGNLYLGYETRKENASYWTNFGIYLPTLTDDKWLATLAGFYGNLDSYESSYQNDVILTLRMNYQVNEQSGLGTLLRFGVSGFINTNSTTLTPSDEFEAMVNYAFQPTLVLNSFQAMFGFSGKMIVTESGDLSDRVFHQFGMTASYKVGAFRPEIFARFPVNERIKSILENVYGLSVTLEM